MKKVSMLHAALIAFSLSVGMGGCIVYADPAPHHAEVYVNSAPPQAYVETRTSNPGGGYFWVDGYWSWRNNQWLWVGGHWERERVGYVYVAPTYRYNNGKHVYVDGGWQQQKGYKASNGNNNKKNNGYGNGQGSNKGNNGYSNGNGSNGNGGGYGTGNNGNGNGNNQKCPQGYTWTNGQCQKSY